MSLIILINLDITGFCPRFCPKLNFGGDKLSRRYIWQNWKPLDCMASWGRHDRTQDRSHCWIELAVNTSTAAPNGSTILCYQETKPLYVFEEYMARAPHVEPASLLMRLFLVWTFDAVFGIWAWNVIEQSSVTPRCTGWCSCWICFLS